MTKIEIAELTDLAFALRSRRCETVVYLNADVRKHALLTVSQHNGVFNAFLRKLRLTAIRHDLNAYVHLTTALQSASDETTPLSLPFHRRRLLLPF